MKKIAPSNKPTIVPEEDDLELEVDRKPQRVWVDGVELVPITVKVPTVPGGNVMTELRMPAFEWRDGRLYRHPMSDHGWWRKGSKITIE